MKLDQVWVGHEKIYGIITPIKIVLITAKIINLLASGIGQYRKFCQDWIQGTKVTSRAISPPFSGHIVLHLSFT